MNLKKTKKFKILSIVLAVFMILSIVSVLSFIKTENKTYAAEVVIDEWSQEGGALIGDTLEVPQSVKLKVDENTVIDAESGVIYFPDGNAKSLEPKLLDMAGKYTLEYRAKHNGKTIKGVKTFVVEESNYYISNTTFSYANFKTADELKYGQYLGDNKKADGIEVTLSEGDYFRFNTPINLYDVAAETGGIVEISKAYPIMDTSLTSDDVITDSSGNPTSKWGTRLGSYFTVKLIDCYDEDNFIECYLWSNQDKRNNIRMTAARAGAGNQDFSSISESTGVDANVEINGKSYAASYKKRYDQPAWGNWAYGNTYNQFTSKNVADSFRLNVNTNEIYYNNTLITDVDNEQIYPGNTFKGFTTGEVYVQYEFQGTWVDQPMEIYIKSILGLEGEELKKSAVVDTTAPLVDINVEYTNAAEKSINVLLNEEYTLPTATVYDVNGKNEYKLAVYYDYYTDNPKTVYLQDGKFVPDKKGVVYTAVYCAEDNFGNKNVDSSGKCTDVINIIPFTGEIFSYAEDRLDYLSASKENTLPNIAVISKNYGVSVEVFAIEPNGNRIDITDSFDGNSYSFLPEFTGEYTIEYVFTDNVYSESYSYKVLSEDDGEVYFSEKIALPSVFIKDAEYDLEPYYCYVATANGFEKEQAKLLVQYDNTGDFVEITDQRNFKVEGNSTLSIVAEYQGKRSKVQTALITDVNFTENSSVNNGYKIYENYFVGADEVVSTSSSVGYRFSGLESATLNYATPLVFNTFSLEFEIPENSANFESVEIVLKEICGVDKGYMISYHKVSTANRVYFTITNLDKSVTYVSGTVVGDFVGYHTISISDDVIVLGEGKEVTVPGVTSRYIDFSINMNNPTGEFALNIAGVCGIYFSNDVTELDSQLVYEKILNPAKIGEEYVLPQFDVSSVFTPISLAKLTYSLVDAQGQSVLDVNGNRIENVKADGGKITIKPTMATTYYLLVSYEGLNVSSDYTLTIMDRYAPVVTFDDGSTSETVVELKAGATHDIKTYTVKDDVTSSDALIVKVMIVDSSNAVVGYNVSSYKFNKVGEYKVVIFAQDEMKNASRTYYKVIVA